jgi:hypothetical protein
MLEHLCLASMCSLGNAFDYSALYPSKCLNTSSAICLLPLSLIGYFSYSKIDSLLLYSVIVCSVNFLDIECFSRFLIFSSRLLKNRFAYVIQYFNFIVQFILLAHRTCWLLIFNLYYLRFLMLHCRYRSWDIRHWSFVIWLQNSQLRIIWKIILYRRLFSSFFPCSFSALRFLSRFFWFLSSLLMLLTWNLDLSFDFLSILFFFSQLTFKLLLYRLNLPIQVFRFLVKINIFSFFFLK